MFLSMTGTFSFSSSSSKGAEAMLSFEAGYASHQELLAQDIAYT